MLTRGPRIKPDGLPARRRLAGVPSAATPPQARALYNHPRFKHLDLARHLAATLPGDPVQLAHIYQVFAAVLAGFGYRREAVDVWGNFITRVRRVAGRYVRYWIGDCDDFAWLMVLRLVKADFPRGALRLCTCKLPGGAGHMVLAIDTDRGTLICDHLQGSPLWADDPAFDGYEWWSIEEPGRQHLGRRQWRSLKIRSLAHLLAGAAQ